MTKDKFFGGVALSNPTNTDRFVSFRSADGNTRLTFQPSDECVGVHVWAHHNKKSVSADIPFNEDEEMAQFIERFFETYPNFELFKSEFEQEGYWG